MSEEVTTKKFLRTCLTHLYGIQFAERAAFLYEAGTEDQRVYIIGCLLLTLTASVHPAYTLLSQRSKSYSQQFCTPSDVVARSEAGLFVQEDANECRLVCFHCSARLRGLSQSWDTHRTASPNCYFVRFRDFVVANGADPAMVDGVRRDVERYIRALRKLKSDLENSKACSIATDFGYSNSKVAFCATRHFMRNGGRLPQRAGDVIAEVHKCEEEFHPQLFVDADVKRLLAPLKCLTPGVGAASSSASSSSSSLALGSQSMLVGRLNPSSGLYSLESISPEQLRELERILRQSAGANSSV